MSRVTVRLPSPSRSLTSVATVAAIFSSTAVRAGATTAQSGTPTGPGRDPGAVLVSSHGLHSVRIDRRRRAAGLVGAYEPVAVLESSGLIAIECVVMRVKFRAITAGCDATAEHCDPIPHPPAAGHRAEVGNVRVV
jgi:hypothetical protein